MHKLFACTVVIFFLVQVMTGALPRLIEDELDLEPTQPRGSSGLLEIAEVYSQEGAPLSVYAGQQTSCALLDDRTMQCWGYNGDGQAGIGGTSSNVNIPYDVLGFGIGRVAVKVSMGSQSSCVLLDNADVKCWGDNSYGNIGDGSTADRRSAVSVDIPTGVVPTDVFAMSSRACMTTNVSGLYCWGSNGNGELGLGNKTDAHVPTGPVQFDAGRSAVQVVGGAYHTCALLDNGSVSCWGDGNHGQHGDGSIADATSPHSYVGLPSGRTAVKLASTYYATCALLDNSSVYCWGNKLLGIGWNGIGQSLSNTPVAVVNLTSATPVDLFAGPFTVCVALGDGDTKCWGRASNGMLGRGLGLNHNSFYDTPESLTVLPYGRSATHVGLGEDHSCVRLDDASIGCFGNANSGQLGNQFGVANNKRGTMNFDQQTYAPNRVTSITEGVSVNLTLQADIYDERGENLSITANTPPGMVFDASTMSLSGSPQFWGQSPTYQISITGTSINVTGTYALQVSRDTDGDGFADLVDDDDDGDGISDSRDSCALTFGNSTDDVLGCPDSDGDGYSNQGDVFPFDGTQFSDADSDGFGDNSSGVLPDACPAIYGSSTRNAEFGCPDADGDGWADQSDAFDADGSQWNDTDSDGFGDSLIGFQGDACPTVVGTSTRDRFGCADADGDGWSDDGDDFPAEPTQWSDRDLDGYGDNQTAGAALIDAFPGDTTQWNDTDGDGHGDNPYGTQGDWFPNDPSRWQDSDRDGVADEDDAFPNDASQREDSDGDGFGDDINGTNGDAFPDDPDEWADPDGDGYGSNVDAFPNDGSQWNDTDGDGHGDNPYGTEGDWFPNDATRWQDSDRDGVADEDDAFDNDATQWNDTDGDGHGDNPSGTAADRFPDDPSRWQDSDRDGVADEDDAFPNDASQQTDRDGDGYGDNPNGNRGDTFPDDASEWADTDADGIGNNADAFPFDPSQTTDADGDGFGDDPRGSGADRFPNDATQWSDIDGDGYGDNAEGTDPDAFIADPTQWSDADGDGYGDNPTGRQADAFPAEVSQWEDQDGDGFGDNQSGANPDPYLFDFDNDGYNDSIDPLPKLASPGDLDNDGTPDSEDAFPEDFREWADSDGDGEGDNADPDDDNDGWADTDELRQGTDPYSGASQPVDSFEIVIPGTQVGLGAWDLIGMFGGIPLFFWIMFGFATRNGRTARFEDELRAAQTRDELEHVALRWEFMLMLRMLGPHQGIRLERLRAELDDRFEAEGQNLSHLERHEADQTALVVEAMDQDVSESSTEDKAVVELPQASTNSTAEPTSAAPAASVEAQKTDEQGYEWYTTEDGTNYYRLTKSGDQWQPFDG